jgi:glyoxylase-like metal-dependent hydrolase (beta-lactamase superfamily II)
MLTAQYEVRRPNGHLLDDLARHNLQPSDIDIVIFTHLHGDHSGWATECIDEGKGLRYRPTFPSAHYYVQAQEYEDATHTNERTRNTYFAENFVPLHEAGMLTLLDGPADITPSVRVVPTPGHTAGHQSVIVQRSKGAREQGSVGDAKDAPLLPLLPGSPAPLLILGDLATYMIQFARLAWVTAYDVLPLQTIETKRYWQKWALEEHAVLISPHDTLLPTGVLQKDNKGFLQVVPDSNG